MLNHSRGPSADLWSSLFPFYYSVLLSVASLVSPDSQLHLNSGNLQGSTWALPTHAVAHRLLKQWARTVMELTSFLSHVLRISDNACVAWCPVSWKLFFYTFFSLFFPICFRFWLFQVFVIPSWPEGEVSSWMNFAKCVSSYKQYHSQDGKHCPHPPMLPHASLYLFFPLVPGNHWSGFYPCSSAFSRILYKYDSTICCLLHLFSFNLTCFCGHPCYCM